MVILLIVVVVFLVLLVGMLLAFLFTRLDRTVVTTRVSMAAEERAYNPGVTLGHRIKPEADYEEQLRQARLEAAKKAAATPRGAATARSPRASGWAGAWATSGSRSARSRS